MIAFTDKRNPNAYAHVALLNVFACTMHYVELFISNNPCAVVMDIASVVGGYDMRRLNDITAFRRYWYRTSLVEALFIGTKKNSSKEDPNTAQTAPAETPSSTELDTNDTISAVIVFAAKVEDFRVSANFAQVMGNAE